MNGGYGSLKRYLEGTDQIRCRIPKGYKATIQEHARRQGERIGQFIFRAIQETMERDNNRSS